MATRSKKSSKDSEPRLVIEVGHFAADRVGEALAGTGIATGMITHPSPANPKANRGREPLVESELAAMGVVLP